MLSQKLGLCDFAETQFGAGNRTQVCTSKTEEPNGELIEAGSRQQKIGRWKEHTIISVQ